MRKIKIKFNSGVTLSLVLLCVMSFVANVFTLGLSNQLLFSTYRGSLLNPLMWLRLFLHSFGHANLNHLLSNLTLFLLVGPIVEERIGALRYLSVIFGASLFIGVVHILLFPHVALCGLSGVVFTLIVLSSFCSSNDGHTIPVTVILVVLLWTGREMYNAVFSSDNVSQFSHLLGGLYGFLYGMRKDTHKS